MRVTTLLVWSALAAGAEDWTEFRGPTGQGHSPATGLPVSWAESKNVVWKTPVTGRGWSSPVVKAGRIWLTTATEDGKTRSLRLLSFDLGTGKPGLDVEVFRFDNLPAAHAKNSFASPTPVLDEDMVYVHFGLATAAVKTSGEVVWRYQAKYNWIHGAGGSPVLYRDLLIFSCDGADVQFVIALDKRTGEVKWRTDRPKPAHMAFSTPLVISTPKGDQLVSTGGHQTVAYDPATGKELWLVEYGDGFSNVPRPVYAGGFVLLCTGFYKPELLAVRPDGSGNVTETHIAWRVGRSVPLTPSPIVVGQEAYMVSDNGILTALDFKTGRIHYQERLGGNYSASPLFADGRIYLSSEDGDTHVFNPGTEFKKIVTNRLDGQLFASPAVAGKSLILRTDSALYRIEEK
jgi:outer membrane protein assembly factor BamB